MFYRDLYRRHLLDMHIGHWNEEFLSQFSPEVYVENLKRAHVNYAMLYLQSHGGFCYFPTQTGVMHPALQRDPALMRKTVELCHRNGIRVCGYYSLIYNTEEHDRHPEWRMVLSDGRSRREACGEDGSLAFASPKVGRYGFCCPNNPDYVQFVFDQIDEMLAWFDCDSLFFDMPFWAHTCHCSYCLEAAGGTMPAEKTDELTEVKSRGMGRFVQAVTDHVKRRRPDMPVYHNFASAVAIGAGSGCNEEVLAACDYACGDLYGDLYNHSFACKFYRNASRTQPFEQMLSRCKPGLRMHTLTKSADELKTAVASTMAHHGATLIIDAIDPVGTMDSRVYDRMGDVFEFMMPYEPWFRGEAVEQVGVYYSMRSRRQDKTGALRGSIGASRAMIRRHIPHGVTGTFHSLDGYAMLVAPGLTALDSADHERLISYVENGGILYISGCGDRALFERLTGHRFVGLTKENVTYVAPVAGMEHLFGWFNASYPLPFEQAAPMVEGGIGKVIATLTLPYQAPDEWHFASIHADPPGKTTQFPAITVHDVGKGHVIWSALPLEEMPFPEYGDILLELLHMWGRPEYVFASDAPATVEITAFRDGEALLLNAVSMDENVEVGTVAPFTAEVTGEAGSVKLLPSGEEVPFTLLDGKTIFQTRPLHIFDMYRIEK